MANLQRVLYADFLGAFSTVLVLSLGAEWLGPHVGIAARPLRITGILLVPFVLFVLRTARLAEVPRARVLGIMGFNVLWLLASGALLTLARTTALGGWIIGVQALLIIPLVYAELRALRQARHDALPAARPHAEPPG